MAMRQALEMPLAERRERHARMLARITSHDIDWWAQQFLTRLAECARQALAHGGPAKSADDLYVLKPRRNVLRGPSLTARRRGSP